MTLNDFVFACPVCRGELEELGADSLHCSVDDLTFGFEAGIWRFLPPERATALAQFRQEYETVRRSEGRGSDDPAFYRALPFVRGNGTRMNADDTEMNQQISQNKKIGKKSDKSAQSLMKNSWKERAHHVGVGGKGQPRPVHVQLRRVAQGSERVVGERGQKEMLHQFGRQLAAAAVAHDDVGMAAQRNRAAPAGEVK